MTLDRVPMADLVGDRAVTTGLEHGWWRLPTWALGSALYVPEDGPWGYVHSAGLDEPPEAVLLVECALIPDWERTRDAPDRHAPSPYEPHPEER